MDGVLREFITNNGVLCVDTQMALQVKGYNVDDTEKWCVQQMTDQEE